MVAATPAAVIDREFIERHHIVESYLAGRLPPRGVTDFERFCAAHPELLDEIGLPERVHAGLRLLEVAGLPEPWQPPSEPSGWRNGWRKPAVALGAIALATALLIVCAVLTAKLQSRGAQIARLTRQIAEQPLEPVTSTRELRLLPSRIGPSKESAVTLGGPGGVLADLKFDLSWAPYAQYRITIEREGEGRVAQLHGLARDSNGDLRLAFNTSALGPGVYEFTIDGLNWEGTPEPAAWLSLSVVH